METKNNVVVIGLLTLILGLGIGYFAGTSTATNTAPVMTHQMPDGSTMSGDMQGAMDGMTMALQGKTGDELDKAFIDGMIVHHEGAVAMARTLLAGTKRPELIKLGNDIITAQTGEIEMMQQWRRDWFGK
jgi:uncharacterized protein (DUF305 family)